MIVFNFLGGEKVVMKSSIWVIKLVSIRIGDSIGVNNDERVKSIGKSSPFDTFRKFSSQLFVSHVNSFRIIPYSMLQNGN